MTLPSPLKVGSSVPSGRYRATATSSPCDPLMPMSPATTKRPSGRTARPAALASPASNGVRTLPPAPNEESRRPLASKRSIANAAPPNVRSTPAANSTVLKPVTIVQSEPLVQGKPEGAGPRIGTVVATRSLIASPPPARSTIDVPLVPNELIGAP